MPEKKYIRFINSNYETLFHIPDGGRIRITYPDRAPAERVCRFIDEYHTDIGGYHYHICEFAERMEQIGAKYVPLDYVRNSGGGGWSSSTYAITVEKSEHGKVTSNRTNASNGSTVTLTVTPDSGYVLDTLTVTDSRGNTIKLTSQSGGKYTFTMPGRAVTVKATFVPLPDDTQKPCDGGAGCPSYGFTDLGGVGTWYHEAVKCTPSQGQNESMPRQSKRIGIKGNL